MSLFYENNSKTCKHWMYFSRLHWLNKVGNIQTVNWSVLILKIYILLILKEIFKIPSLSHYNIHTYTYIHIHIHSGIYIYLHTNWKYYIYTIRTIIVRNLLKFYSMLFEFSNIFLLHYGLIIKYAIFIFTQKMCEIILIIFVKHTFVSYIYFISWLYIKISVTLIMWL